MPLFSGFLKPFHSFIIIYFCTFIATLIGFPHPKLCLWNTIFSVFPLKIKIISFYINVSFYLWNILLKPFFILNFCS